MNRGDQDRDRVRAAVNLVEQFASVTKVKRSGRSHMALCPFHQEKTPSLSIDAARGLFYCHGCHKGGDVFTLVQETQGLSFPEALQTLAREAGIVLSHRPGSGRSASERERLVEVMRRAMNFYTLRLLAGADAGPARSYLRSRGYDRSLVEKFNLGFSPLGEPFLRTELRSAGVSDSEMVWAGLIIRRGPSGRRAGDGFRDRFWGRVMFPIHDVRGDPVGFGARLLSGAGPKYLNSPETALYHKSRLLYGLHLARKQIGRAGEAVVVEGYTDVIALHQAGMESAVATCGTALGKDHLEVLGRLGDRVVLAFDADRAGSNAVLRGEQVSRRSGGQLDLRVAELPDGKDPADLVQEGRLEELREALRHARPVLQYRMERRLAQVDPTEPESRARAVNELAALVAEVGDPTTRAEYEQALSRGTGVGIAEIRSVVSRSAGSRRVDRKDPRPPPSPRPRRPRRPVRRGSPMERELLRAILLNHPALREMKVDGTLFTEGLHRRIFEAIEADWRATPPGEPTPIRWQGGGSFPPDGEESGSLPEEARLALLEISSDLSSPGDPRPMVIRCRRESLGREAASIRARMGRLATDDPKRDELLEKLGQLERRRQELTGDIR